MRITLGPIPAARRNLSCLLALLAVTAWFLAPGPASGATKYAAEFLKIGAGARALGMGGGFTALADDASASYWNPAGLLFLAQSELLVMHAEHLGSLANYDYAAFAQPLERGGRPSALGVGLVRFAVDDILITRDAYVDQNGNGRFDEGEPIDPDRFRRDSDTEYALMLNYATAFRPTWLVGGTVKLIRQDLVGTTSFGIGLDVGMLYLPSPSWTLGVQLADVTTTQISWDTGRRETVAPSVKIGTAYTREMAPFQGLVTVSADIGFGFDGRNEASQFGTGLGGDFLGGIEYWLHRTVALRVGTRAGDFTAGAGIRYGGFGVDYAFVPNEDLNDTHRVSGSIQF
jgi:hypothetical protein